MNDVLQSQPAILRIAHAGLEFHVYLVIVKIEPHFATQVGAGANSPPPHHVVDIEPQCAFDCRPPPFRPLPYPPMICDALAPVASLNISSSSAAGSLDAVRVVRGTDVFKSASR